MAKTIIYFFFVILLISIVYAATENFKFLINPFTGKGDRSVSFNQSNKNWTFANLTADKFLGDGSELTGISAGGTSVWNSSGNNVYLNDSTGSLGIGKVPTVALDVVGDIKNTGDISTGTDVGDQFLAKNSGTTPVYSFAGDTDTGISSSASNRMSFWSEGNQIFDIRQSNILVIPAGSASAPAIQIADLKTGIFQAGDDKLGLAAGGIEFCRMDETTQDVMVCNEGSLDIDFRWESNNNVNMLFIDGGNDRIGIGTNIPTEILVILGNVSINASDGSLGIFFVDATNKRIGIGTDSPDEQLHITGDAKFESKLDIGVPGAAGGLDVGEGGSYTTDKDGTTIVQAFTYDASAASGSRFTELTLDVSNTFLGNAGDRFYIGSQNIFWAVRFSPTRGKTDEPFQVRYYNGSNITNTTYMGILKNNATSVGIRILNQTVEKEYITWDHEIINDWTTADNIDDLIPDGTTNMYWIIFEVPNSGLSTAPIVDEIKVRGTDFDLVSGTSYPILWGNTRIENHERIALTVVKSPGGTTTTDIDIDSAHQQTVFDFNGAGDLVSFLWVMPEAIDTSNPLHVTLDYSANAADTFDIDLSMSKLRNATPIGNSIAPDFTETTAVTSDAANTFYTGQVLAESIPIQNMTSGDELSFEIQRTDGTNAMYPLSFIIHYISFSIGEIVTAD